MINNQHFSKGGAHKVYFNSAQLLRDNGHEVFFFSMQDERNVPVDGEASFPEPNDFRNMSPRQKILKWPNFIFNKGAGRAIRKFIEEIKPDIAHVHLFMGGLTVSILRALSEKQIPIVHSVHDYRLICPAYLFLDGNERICERCKGGRFYNCLTHRCSEKKLSQSLILSIDSYYRRFFQKPEIFIKSFIFVSRFIKDKHINFRHGLKNNNYVLFNFNPDLWNTLPSSEKGHYFLFVGRLSREKGIKTLVKAARNANIRLKIVGDGPLREELQEDQNIELVGFVTGERLHDVIRKASYVVVPSEWYENNPLAIIESFGFGKPVVAAKIGGIPELVSDQENGYLFRPGDSGDLTTALRRAASTSDHEYALQSSKARDFAEKHFNPEIHYQRLMQIYVETIDGSA